MILPTRVTDTDLERLDAFLMSEAVPEAAMDVSTLEGFLTALVIGPRMVPPSQWLPWAWDFEEGRADVEFADIGQANEMIGLVMGLMNRIADTFADDPARFEPVFMREAVWGAAEWCEGFLAATQHFDGEAWAALWAHDAFKDGGKADRVGLVTPFMRLGDETGFEITKREGDAERWVTAIVPALVAIHAHWRGQRSAMPAPLQRAPQRRDSPKVGRNDPCPCGSGQKYKKCCGQAAMLH